MKERTVYAVRPFFGSDVMTNSVSILDLVTAASHNIVEVFGGNVMGCHRWRAYIYILAKIAHEETPYVDASGIVAATGIPTTAIPNTMRKLRRFGLLVPAENNDNQLMLGPGTSELLSLSCINSKTDERLLKAIVLPEFREDLPTGTWFGTLDLFGKQEATNLAATECWKALWQWRGSVVDHPYFDTNSYNVLTLVVMAMFRGLHMAGQEQCQVHDIYFPINRWFGFTKEYVRREIRNLEDCGVVMRIRGEYVGSIAFKLNESPEGSYCK
jgi:hypothetical protein